MEKCGKVGIASSARRMLNNGGVLSRTKMRSVGVQACSGCAGDYEDPERTAWDEQAREGDEDALVPHVREEGLDDFPVE